MGTLRYRVRLRSLADDEDLFVATSVRDGTHPYIKSAPISDGQEVDPITGRVTQGQTTLEIIDWWGTLCLFAPDSVIEDTVVASVEVIPDPLAVATGEDAPLTAIARNAAGQILPDQTVAWSIDDENVATISATGLLSGVATGTATVTAEVDGVSGMLLVQVDTSLIPASIEVDPASLTVNVDGHVTANATVRDAGGQECPGETVTWSSSDETKVTVSADSGDDDHQVTVTGVAIGGTPFIQAHCGAIDSAQVPVTVQVATTNEPAGMTQLVNYSCGSLSGWYNLSNFVEVSLENDATEPESPTDVVRLRWPPGTTSGGKPGRDFVFGQRQREIYVRYVVKYASPYTKHPSATEKALMIGTAGNSQPGGSSNMQEIICAWHGGSTSSTRMLLGIQVPAQTSPDGVTTNGYLASNINGATDLVTLDVWHVFECHMVANTGGALNGRLRWWLDGVEIGDHDQLKFNNAGYPTADGEIVGVRFQHYRGGAGAMTFTVEENVYQGHLYISGIPL